MNGQECRFKTIEVDGKIYERLPFTAEVCGIPDADLPDHCHDCGVAQGGVHHAFCCLDICPVDETHGQTLGCSHGIQAL